MIVVGGFDLSLTSTGMCAVPADWGTDFDRVTVATAGRAGRKDWTELQRMARVREIRDAVVHFARRTGITHAVIEQYAFSAQLSHAHAAGELGGVVRLALLEAGIGLEGRGIDLDVVSPASARKLLGKQPRKDGKIWAAGRLVAMGAPAAWGMDILDAFAVCNYKLAEFGFGLLAPETAA